ncbi:hypothetical protein [Paraburkholderia caribensis]|uniref:hypothetical protein n=1 Tax=Paraburkholderia caribensis TaxID=75105 RepID=UPI001CB611B1|nr:hypothetical protein [Paraburkholderia caribensis]CAG9250002.1 hypothetical protein PCAR4_260099 [Paraburkholderia caribensis]
MSLRSKIKQVVQTATVKEEQKPAPSFFDMAASAAEPQMPRGDTGWNADCDTRVDPNLTLQTEISAPDAHERSVQRSKEIAASGFVDVQKGEHWLHPRESRRMNAGDFSTHSWRQRQLNEQERAHRKAEQEKRALKGLMWLVSVGSGSNT